MSPGSPDPYYVSFSEAQKQRMRDLSRQAATAGRAEDYVQAVEFIDAQLARDPTSFGDLNFTLGKMGLPVYMRICSNCPHLLHSR